MADSHFAAFVGNPSSAASASSAWDITGSGPWLLAFMLTIIILMTACGNMLLIALVFAHRALRCTSNCFLVSLFFSDLMVALVVMPPAMLNVLSRRQAKRVAALSNPPHPHASLGEPSRPPSPGAMAGNPDRDDCSHHEPLVAPNAPNSVTSERRLAHRQGRRALKASLTLGVLLGLFFSTWLPFFITNMAQAVCECVPVALFDAITWLGYCNSTMNPIIYPLFMRDFKRALGKLLPCCSSRSPRRPSPALSLSLRNSGEPHMISSPASPLPSDPMQPPATATDAVNLLDAAQASIELPLLLPNQVDTLD
uniref:G-protein coupled receptors family 1 profile domain-containing protein n=1 Tax=Knipowitschia caucasica TaxID=637954 RepID=A0AAV2LWQ8_KNICA